ncbi:CES4A isoform 11, partial [Pan troglodytes]
KVAHLAGCNHNSTQILVNCLRALSGAKVMRVSNKMRFLQLNFQRDPEENITKEQVPLVVEEYLDNVNEHDWKMLRNRMMDIVQDATFVYATLQTAHYHRGLSMGKEKALSLRMMKYWANFARTGNPNDGNLPCWPRYNKDEKYLQLDFTTRVGMKLKEKKMAFWMSLYQSQRPEKQRQF